MGLEGADHFLRRKSVQDALTGRTIAELRTEHPTAIILDDGTEIQIGDPWEVVIEFSDDDLPSQWETADDC